MNTKQTLINLAKSGKYVFHGSPAKISKLVPRQAYRFDMATKQNIPDGDPCVAATPFLDIAIFRSLINAQIAKKVGIRVHRSSFGLQNDIPYFKSTLESYNNTKKSTSVGYVHVLDIKQFKRISNMEYRSYVPVIPLNIIEVHGTDLPKNIEIIPYT